MSEHNFVIFLKFACIFPSLKASSLDFFPLFIPYIFIWHLPWKRHREKYRQRDMAPAFKSVKEMKHSHAETNLSRSSLNVTPAELVIASCSTCIVASNHAFIVLLLMFLLSSKICFWSKNFVRITFVKSAFMGAHNRN